MTEPQISTVALEALAPDPRNARAHPPRSRAALAASLDAFGAARSVVIDGAGIVRAGNGTLEAARAAGITQALVVETDGSRLVVVKRPDWSEAQAVAYAIADNRTQELSHFDSGALQAALLSIADAAPTEAIEALGFSEAELSKLLEQPVEQPIEVSAHTREAASATTTQPGDVWILGAHRLVCGRPTAENARALLEGERAQLVLAALEEPPLADATTLTVVEAACAPGGLVFELSAGPGAALLACEQRGRRWAAIEADPSVCDALIERWQVFTGRQAVRRTL